MAKLSKKVVTGILDKLEIEYTSKITLDKAKSKLNRAIEKKGGIPEDVELSADEIAILEEMGFEIDLDEDDEDQESTDEDLDDEEEEEEEEEEEKISKKKSSKKSSSKKNKKEPKKSKKKMGKFTAVCKILKKRKNHIFEKLVAEADALYVKNGGSSNIDGTKKFCVTTLKVLTEYGAVSVDGDTIKVL